jgi:hypothetical protein
MPFWKTRIGDELELIIQGLFIPLLVVYACIKEITPILIRTATGRVSQSAR